MREKVRRKVGIDLGKAKQEESGLLKTIQDKEQDNDEAKRLFRLEEDDKL